MEVFTKVNVIKPKIGCRIDGGDRKVIALVNQNGETITQGVFDTVGQFKLLGMLSDLQKMNAPFIVANDDPETYFYSEKTFGKTLDNSEREVSIC